jgi:cysteine desulfurase family protein
MIYVDNAATSFPKPEAVLEAVAGALRAPASPGRSGHRPALEASRLVYGARKAVKALFGLPGVDRVVFTPNITWAINIALAGLSFTDGDEVITTSLEHNSTARPARRLEESSGILWKRVAPGKDGLIAASGFKDALTDRTRLAIVNHASNVTGALAPLRAIKEAIGEVPLLVDTAQTAGAVPLNDLGSYADIITFTGHKGLLGPTGTGGLWIREGLGIRPLAVGGSGSRSESLVHPDFLPDALEAGTLNTHGLAGLAAGINYVLERGVANIRAHEMALTRIFLENAINVPGLSVLGPGPGIDQRVATVSVTLEGYSSSDLSRELEAGYGIMTRAGLHCAPLAHEATGTFPGGATRFSFGAFNTEADALAAASALEGLAAARRDKSKT